MTDRPIIFSGPMVVSLLAGRKAQTRRILRLPPKLSSSGNWEVSSIGGAGVSDARGNPVPQMPCIWQIATGATVVPNYAVGDRLWVKETWQVGMSDGGPCVAYRANADRVYPVFTGPDEGAGPSFDYDAHPAKAWRHGYWVPDIEASGPWGSALHTPRWASRLTLLVTEVKIEPLQVISQENAIAEGIERYGYGNIWGWVDYGETNPNMTRCFADPRASFRSLWESLHGADGWEANPFVVALTFRVERENIDRLLS